ncbi:MAG TPA: alpha-L-arabinofuranosidase C-terminal domain-containing protein [Anaerolineaceae bacterium]
MDITTITLHTDDPIAPVDERIFGGFLEHLGRAVYEGVYDPDSPQADEHGFRKDVMQALAKLRMTAMRYPGGNFASGYHWLDGVGPKATRPKVLELAWQSMEPNLFGTDEFIQLASLLHWTPMMTINLGTGTPEEARNWVEYCNSRAGTRYADMRKANGSADPYGVKLWCLGNEMDGPWQLGHVPADQYAIRAQQAAKMMRDTDPTVETVACGSCTTGLPSYMEWDRTVLEYMGDFADYISLHRYVGNREGDTPEYLAVTNSIDRQIEEMDAVCRYVAARRRSKKRVYLCFDEWNVWYRATGGEHVDGRGKYAPHLLEEVYNLEDALVVAGFLNSFIRHADVVKIANLAQIVNVIAPILTQKDRLLVQSIYYPFEMFSARRNGVALKPIVKGSGYESRAFGAVNYIDTSAILGDGVLHLFLSNRSLDSAAPVVMKVTGHSLAGVSSAEIVTGASPKAANTFEQPDQVKKTGFNSVTAAGNEASMTLPPLSVAAVSFNLK